MHIFAYNAGTSKAWETAAEIAAFFDEVAKPAKAHLRYAGDTRCS